MGNFDDINWIAVIIAALAYFALGALWYSKALFAKRWIADLKIDVNNPDAKKGMGMMFGGSLLLMLVQCIALAVRAGRMEGLTVWMSGLKLGLLTGCCFSAASVGINYFYEKKPMSLFLINAGYAIAGNVIAGIIICSWR